MLLEAGFPVDSPVRHQQLRSGLDGPRRPHIRSLSEVRIARVQRDAAVDDTLVRACIDVPGAALGCDDHRATQTFVLADVHGLLVRLQLLVADDSAVELCNQRILLDRFGAVVERHARIRVFAMVEWLLREVHDAQLLAAVIERGGNTAPRRQRRITRHVFESPANSV